MSRILRHWIVALPILLVVAGLGFRQLAPYPPSIDEFFSLHHAGWLSQGPHSPSEILDDIRRIASDHMPSYFMLLGAWGSLAGTEIAMARVPGVFFALLALAMAYRLARDHVGTEAGFFAIVIIASNAFYNFYLAQARMYPMLVFLSGAVLWLYLRLIDPNKPASRRRLLALMAAVFCLASAHAASAKLLAALGFYHLLFAPKNRRWWQVSAAVIAGLLLLSPWLLEFVPNAIAFVDERIKTGMDGWSTLQVWSLVTWNGWTVFLALTALGLALGIRQGSIKRKPHLLIAGIYGLVVVALAELSPAMAYHSMRFLLDGFPLLALVVATALYALYRYRKWLAALPALWVLAGMSFQASANWLDILSHERMTAFHYPPAHIISRLARQEAQKPILFGDRINTYILDWTRWVNFDHSQRDHYFGQHGMTLTNIEAPAELLRYPLRGAETAPEIWLAYRPAYSPAEVLDDFDVVMEKREYEACGTAFVRADWRIRRYAHQARGCASRRPSASQQTERLNYEFYAAEVSADGSQIIFVDRWQPLAGQSLERLSISLQLIAPDGTKVAQLDRPMANRGEMRQYELPIYETPAGVYKLVAIVYNYETGERHPWPDHDGVMLDLGAVAITNP